MLKLFTDHVLKHKEQQRSAASASENAPSGKSNPANPAAGTAPGLTKSGHKPTAAASSGTAAAAVDPSRPHGHPTPIIIVPASLTGVISMLNAQELLQRSKYVTLEERKAAGVRREQSVFISRALPDGRIQQFKVT